MECESVSFVLYFFFTSCIFYLLKRKGDPLTDALHLKTQIVFFIFCSYSISARTQSSHLGPVTHAWVNIHNVMPFVNVSKNPSLTYILRTTKKDVRRSGGLDAFPVSVFSRWVLTASSCALSPQYNNAVWREIKFCQSNLHSYSICIALVWGSAEVAYINERGKDRFQEMLVGPQVQPNIAYLQLAAGRCRNNSI